MTRHKKKNIMKKYSRSLAGKKPEELKKEERDARERLANLRFDLAQGKVKNVAEIRVLRKTIARILTMLANKHE